MRTSKALVVFVALAGCGGGGALAPSGRDAASDASDASDVAEDVDSTADLSSATADTTDAVEAPDLGFTASDATDAVEAPDHDGAADAGADERPEACPAPPIETFTGATTTVTCPPTGVAVDGIVATTCEFPYAFAPNEVFTGPVVLESHLDRDFADFDVGRIADGRFQLMCAYADADGMGVGGIYRFIVATSCTATSAAGFTCTQ